MRALKSSGNAYVLVFWHDIRGDSCQMVCVVHFLLDLSARSVNGSACVKGLARRPEDDVLFRNYERNGYGFDTSGTTHPGQSRM